ncbi:MAG: hypothetical protein HOI35_11750 [Woeseia sp.]|jgi:hypothetical protein|nr:hypothetical protein [Woeseia sp.]
MRLLATISLGLALCASGANAQLRPSGTNGYDLSERALESATVRMFLQSDGNGKLVARECPNCTPMRLIVTPKTQVFMGGNPITWNADLNFGANTVDIFYDHDSKMINRIVAP